MITMSAILIDFHVFLLYVFHRHNCVLGSMKCGVKDDVDMSLITKLKKIRSRSKHNEVRDDDYERRKIMSQEKHPYGPLFDCSFSSEADVPGSA
jgi:hypothetical protein